MHDLTRIEAVCKKAEEIAGEHGARRVIRILLEVSDLSHFIPEDLQETFLLIRGTSPLLRDTDLEFCRSEDTGSDEMLLHDVELEVPEHEQTEVH